MGYLSCKIGSSVVESHRKERRSPVVKTFSFRDLEAATGGFSVDTLLGKGSHGCVYKAVLENGLQVAVKRPSYGRRLLQDEAAFDNEIRILSALNNPRLVKLLGVSQDANKEKLLVVELMHNGTLYDLLHESGGDNREAISWSRRVHVALQTARAVYDIHSITPPLIHRDIKSSNIFIDRHWNAKLGDFGLALWGHADSSSVPPAGTLGYLDPEYTTPDMLSTKNDIFSFGILLLEIISGRNAIDVHHNPPSIVDWAVPLIKAGKAHEVCDPKLPPPRNISFVKQMAVLAARCVRDKSSKRPDMLDVVQHLQEISNMMGFSMFNGISCKMKLNAVRNPQKQLVVEEQNGASQHQQNNSKGYKKGSQRSLRVYDESRSLSDIKGWKFDSDSNLESMGSHTSTDGEPYDDVSQSQERISLVDLFREPSLQDLGSTSNHQLTPKHDRNLKI